MSDNWRQRRLDDRVEALLRESWPRRWPLAELATAAGTTPASLVVIINALRAKQGVPIRTERVYSLPPDS